MIFHFDQVGSTNDIAKDIAKAGQIAPFWVFADTQYAGRGRRGKDWHSLKGNLFATGIYSFKTIEEVSPLYSFVIAIALRDTLKKYIEMDRIKLKWPNDVFIDGAKISGILLENWQYNGAYYLTIGIGVNLTIAPDIEGRKTIALGQLIEGQIPQTRDFLEELISNFNKIADIFQTQGFAPICQIFMDNAYGIGHEINVHLGDEIINGTFKGINEKGELVLHNNEGNSFLVQAGDVFFPQ